MDSFVEDAIDSEDQESIDEMTEKVNDATETNKTDDSGNGKSKGMSEEKLDEIVDSLQTNISVIGCGGGGCNTIDRINETGIDGAELVAINTDAQDLKRCTADTKLLVGKDTCKGRGAGSVPDKGRKAAEEDSEKIENIVKDQDMVFITAGMGGGTGTGVAPVVAEKASKYALTISIVTTPFSAEGQARMQNATAGLRRLEKNSDTVIVVPNDRLLELAPNLPLKRAFKVADEVLMRSVKGITELITEPSLVNLDFADVKTVMEGGGVAMIGLGESDSTAEAKNSVLEALDSPLLDINISNASNVLVNVTGGPGMQIEEAQDVVDLLNDRVSDDARIIWGTGVEDELEGKIRTMLVITGVESPQIHGNDQSRGMNYDQNYNDTNSSTSELNDESSENIDYVE